METVFNNLNNKNLASADELGIICNGNKCSVAAAVGQYVILRNSTISGCDDGLYTATQAIPANTAITSTYLTAASGGGLNALNSNFRLRLLWSGSAGKDQTITLNESISNFKIILVVARASSFLTYETHIIPTDAIEYIPSATTTTENAWVVGVKYTTSAYATTLIGFLSETQVYVMDRNQTAGWSGFAIARIYGMK